MMKILLDTDIGTNIDDALCLAYLLANPNCDLLGITTVTGSAEKRAKIASALCRYSGVIVPIFPGEIDPIAGIQIQNSVQQDVILPDWDHQQQFPQRDAIPFLIDIIRANPGEVTLLCVGPLTNIARLLIVDPQTSSLLRKLVIMGGVYTEETRKIRPTETNTIIDPYAVQIIFEQTFLPFDVIGLDCTLKMSLPTWDVIGRLDMKKDNPLGDLLQLWQLEREEIIFHDPLAAASIFAKVCQFSPGHFKIDLNDDMENVVTSWVPKENGQNRLSIEGNSHTFFSHYFSVLSMNY